MNIVLEILVVSLKVFLCYLEALVGLFYKPKKNISGRTAVLTGGGGDIGKFIALELVQRKVKLAIWDVNKVAADKVKNELVERGFSNIFTFKCDITKKEEVQQVAAETRRVFGEVDFLFNNAGVLAAKDILDLSEGEIRRTMEVNCIAQFWTIQEFLPSMLKRNYGHIINTASMAGKVGVAWLTDYCASKFGVVGLSEALRLDIHRRGKNVKVTAICPTMVNTQMVTNTQGHTQPYSRFDKFEEPYDAARTIVAGMERDEHTVYVPWKMSLAAAGSVLVPGKVSILLTDFLRAGYFPKDYKLD